MNTQKKLQVMLAVALVISVAGNIFGYLHHRQVSNESVKSQELVASLQSKIKTLEQYSTSSPHNASGLSREEYLQRRAELQRKRSSLSRLAGQKQDADSKMAEVSREFVQSRQQGSPQIIQ
ncbi:MerC domain-containing protein [Microbulbifer mangrovi]|uniref:MerC domain-containing protein n=1 Tax=Microbulbifer mangrovi TaxID=927787 RepID=UPI00117D34E5|nr:MerC domain-containing protein [Microbulbifer mangrovi]